MKKCTVVGVIATAILCGCMSESERLAYEQEQRTQREVAQKKHQEEQKKQQEEVAKAKKAAAEKQAKDDALRREKYWTDLATRNYDLIIAGLTYTSLKNAGKLPDRDAYVRNPSLRQAKGAKNPHMWKVERAIQAVELSNWVGARSGISQEIARKGQSTMESFAAKYMPNAFAKYEKYRDAAAEVQSLFNEEFMKTKKTETTEVQKAADSRRNKRHRKLLVDSNSSEITPIDMSPDNTKWTAFCKLLKGFSKARTMYFRSHDELCHYYILYKCGGISSEELAKIDAKPISIKLLEENVAHLNFVAEGLNKDEILSEKVKAFAGKFAPETEKLYQKLFDEREELVRNLAEIKTEMEEMDVARFELGMIALCEKINYETRTLRELSKELQSMYAEHACMEKDSEAIAKEDHALAMKWKDFVRLLPGYVKSRTSAGVVDPNGILSKWYKEDKLRLWQWNAVLGSAKGIPESLNRDRTVADPFEILVLGESKLDNGWREDCSSGLLCRLDSHPIDDLISAELKTVMSYGRLCEQQGWKCGCPEVKLNFRDIKVLPRTEVFYAAGKTSGTRFDEVLGNKTWGVSDTIEMEDGKVLYADYTVAAVAIDFYKYRVTNADKNFYGQYHGYQKIGKVAPTPLTKVINQHMPNGSEVEIVYCGEANDPHPDSYHAEHYLKIIAK